MESHILTEKAGKFISVETVKDVGYQPTETFDLKTSYIVSAQ